MKSLDEWLKTQDIPTQNALVGGAAKGTLYRTGKIKLKDFTGRRGDPISVEDLRAKFNILKVEAEKPSVAVGEKISPFGRHTDEAKLRVAGDKWERDLTEGEKEGVYRFTGNDYKQMRAVMRGYDVDSLDPTRDYKDRMFAHQLDFDRQTEWVANFRKATNNAPEYEGDVFRGLSKSDKDLAPLLKDLIKKKTINMPADSSATRDALHAEKFLRKAGSPKTNKRVMYLFHQRTGRSIDRASQFTKEKEVIIRQKTRFDLVKIHYSSDEVRAEAIGDLFKFRRTKKTVFGGEELESSSKEYFDKFQDAEIIIELEEV